ncbi:MAG: hypothetical protein NTU61_02850 [Candidatus Altiarchaeota archaeon]|nr:hypothetical protein [Candidatus Altiarchaeota archaeon]
MKVGGKTRIILGILIALGMLYVFWELGQFSCSGSAYSSKHGEIVPQLAAFEVMPDGDLDAVFTNGVGHPIQINRVDIISEYYSIKYWFFSYRNTGECFSQEILTAEDRHNFRIQAKNCVLKEANILNVSLSINYTNLNTNNTYMDYTTITKNNC